MTDTNNLGLPCIDAAQAQKHVTHNEALWLLDSLVQLAVLDRDLTAPPGSPSEGQRWIVKDASPTGAWAGHGNHIAAWQDGGWQFSIPKTGWLAYVVDEGALLAWAGSAWVDAITAITSLNNMVLLGVGTTADATNPFSAELNNILWVAKSTAEGGDGDLRWKMSKESAADTLSMLFQDNYSGRAEIGLTGDDNFHFKVSADGSTWLDAIVIDRSTGKLSLGQGVSDAGATRAQLGAAPYEALAHNNAVVNPAVDISQELGTTGATLASSTAKYIADCFEAQYVHGAGTAVVTSAQIAAASFPSALAGFQFGHQIKATTAITAPASGDYAKHRSKIEGYRIAHWGWGASGAAAIVVAFELYSTASGTAFVKLSNSDQSRCYYHEITVAAGWNFLAFTVPGDTTGTWQATTSVGLVFELFVSGKETTPASTLDAWGATNKVQTTNSTNLLGTNNNTTVLTGLFIAAGTQVPVAADLPNLMRSADEELRRCQRYYWKTFARETAPAQGTGGGANVLGYVGTIAGATTQRSPSFSFPVAMRIAPTMTAYNPVNVNAQAYNAIYGADCSATAFSGVSDSRFWVQATGNAGMTVGDFIYLHATANARL